MQVSGWWLGMAMWHVFPCTHTPKSGGVAMGKATVVVAVCVCGRCDGMCMPSTHHTQDVRAATKAHAIHTMCVCVRQKSGQWMSTVALWCVVVVGEEGWRGGWWWQKHRKG